MIQFCILESPFQNNGRVAVLMDIGQELNLCSSVRVRASPSSECGDCSLGMNMYEPHYWPGLGWAGLGWSPPAALFVHIVNIKFHNTFAFTVVTRPGCSSTLPRPRAGRSRTVIIVMTVLARASNEPSRIFPNHREGPY